MRALTSLLIALTMAWSAELAAQPAAPDPRPAPPPAAAPGTLAPDSPPAQPDTAPAPPPAEPDPSAPTPSTSGQPPSEVPPPPPPTEPDPPLAAAPGPRLSIGPTLDRPEPPARKIDLLLPLSVGSMAVGAVFMIAGGITLETGDAGEYCGITGCVDRPSALNDNISSSLIGAGAGFATVGAASFLGWAAKRPAGDERRKSEGLYVAGFNLTALGAAGLGVGFAQMATYGSDEISVATAWPWFLAGGVSLSVGIPLYAVGAKNQSLAARELERTAPAGKRRMRSPARMTAGIVLCSIAGFHGTASAVLMAVDATVLNSGYVFYLAGLPLLGSSVLASAIGVPLVVSGAKQVVPTAADALAEELTIPEVTAGPGGVQATWRLP